MLYFKAAVKAFPETHILAEIQCIYIYLIRFNRTYKHVQTCTVQSEDKHMYNKKHSESAYLRHAYFEERETI